MQKNYQALLMTDYAAYCYHVHGGSWVPSKFHKALCYAVQDFVNKKTDNAFNILIISTPPQHGKLISDDTPVLTRSGWKNHGDLVAGDEVIGLDGQFKKVTYVFPKHYADTRVYFDNGEHIDCHNRHEWVLENGNTVETRALHIGDTLITGITSVIGVDKIPHIQGNCITVEGGIYCVGKKMIPTHNSTTITETLPSWYLGRNPTHRVIEISYSEDFAKRFGRRNRRKIKEYGGEIFGIKMASSPDTDLDFELDNGVGGMISRGITSGVTGNPANLMIIDDPIKNRQEADSESTRGLISDEWLNSFRSRLAPDAKVIVIMTRWHEADLAGYLMENETNVSVINFPLEAEENDILGRNIGDALCPEIGKGNKWLADFKKGYMSQEGSRAWNALYQGHPTGLEGNMIKREWWQFYDELPELNTWVMSVDAAFKDGDDNDFVAIQVWGKNGPNMYLVDSVKKHLNLPATVNEILRLRSMYPECKTTLVEDKANGPAVISILRKMISGVIAVNPIGGKVSRVNAIIGAIESGNVYLPRKKHFSGELIEECAAFPNGAHDDMVDSMSQGLNRLIYNKATREAAKKVAPLEKYFPKYKKVRKGDPVGRKSKINVV